MVLAQESWRIAAGVAVGIGVAFSVLLISVSFGVSSEINQQLSSPALRHTHIVDVGLVNSILFLLTVVVTGGMLVQTAAATFILGVTVMTTRRDEVALRRQSGVLRSTLISEFVRGMLWPCLIGGVIGEVVGLAIAFGLSHLTVLPVEFNPVSLLGAFPVTVVLALVATLIPAWRFANTSPATLRRA